MFGDSRGLFPSSLGWPSVQSCATGNCPRIATPRSPSPHPQRWPVPRGGYRQSGQAVRLASPPSDQWLGKVDLTGVPRAREPGRSGARLSRSQGRAPASSPSPPPPEGAEQRCFVPAAATLSLGCWGWGRVGPLPGPRCGAAKARRQPQGGHLARQLRILRNKGIPEGALFFPRTIP